MPETKIKQLKLYQYLFLSGFLMILGLFVSQEALAYSCANVPLSGNYTTTTTDPEIASCAFSETVNGVEQGNLTISSGATLTINAGQTVVWNSGYSVIINGSIAINKPGGQLKKTNIWMIDADNDGYPATLTQYAQDSQPTGGKRRKDFTKFTYVSGCKSPTKGSVVDNGNGTCTWTWQPDGTDGKDNDVCSGYPDENWGAYDNMIVGYYSATVIDRGLIEFTALGDNIPSGSIINSALSKFKVRNAGVAGQYYRAEFVTASWVELTVTWNTQPARSTPYSPSIEVGAVGTWATFDVKTLVQEIINNGQPNNGWYLTKVVETSGSRVGFWSSDYGTAGDRPKIEVTYVSYFISDDDDFCKSPTKGSTVNNGNGTCTWTWQPDATDGKDTYVMSNAPDTNYGSETVITVNRNNYFVYDSFTLIEFTTLQDNIPAYSTINSATTSLKSSAINRDPGEMTIYGQRLIASWNESTVTWNNKPGVSTPYTGSINTTGYVAGDWFNFDVEPIVSKIIDGTYNNYGWYMRFDEPQGPNRQVQWRSSDYATAADRPKIEVTYTP